MSEEKDINKKSQDGNKNTMLIIILLVLLVFAIVITYVGSKDKDDVIHDGSEKVVELDNKVEAETNQKYKEGVHYTILEKGIDVEGLPDKNVVKYLWLGCEHCQNFHSVINDYKKENPEVTVDYRHAANAERWALDARIFYALKETANFAYYDDLINFYKKTRTEYSKLPDYNDLAVFLKDRNIDPDAFFRVVDSDLVVRYIQKSINEMRENNITAVPTIIVNGKYRISSSLPEGFRSQKDYNGLVNYLLNLK